ncbi:MAG TPA: DUF2059 domain-containing protein [Fluviicoccus sp.]|nr:DUF2059 domain-containing protein [Fluviicoccus sp.]
MRRLLPLLSVLLLAGCQSVPVPPPVAKANAAELLQASRFRTPLYYLETPLYDPDVTQWIPQRFLDEVRGTIQSTIDNPFTDAQLQQVLSRTLSGEDMQAVIDFYQSPTGQAVLQAESSFRERLNTPAAAANSNDTLALLKAVQLNDALSAVFMASANALIERLDNYDCLALMQIPGSHIGLNIAKRNRVGFMSRQVRRSLANLYGGLTAEELQGYLQFAQSPPGQRYFKARAEALATIGTDFGQRVAEAIAPGLPECVGSIRTSGG